MEDGVKPDPEVVRVKDDPPAVVEVGLILVDVGMGFPIVKDIGRDMKELVTTLSVMVAVAV